MEKQHPSRLSYSRAYFLILACGWTLVIVVSLMASISVHRQEIVTIAQNIARAYTCVNFGRDFGR
jgi:hypothetical protein